MRPASPGCRGSIWKVGRKSCSTVRPDANKAHVLVCVAFDFQPSCVPAGRIFGVALERKRAALRFVTGQKVKGRPSAARRGEMEMKSCQGSHAQPVAQHSLQPLGLSQAKVRQIKAGVSIEGARRRHRTPQASAEPHGPSGARQRGRRDWHVRSAGGRAGTAADQKEPKEDEGLRPIADRLLTELTTYRTHALRDARAQTRRCSLRSMLSASSGGRRRTGRHVCRGLSCLCVRPTVCCGQINHFSHQRV